VLLARDHGHQPSTPATQGEREPSGYREGRWGGREVEISGVSFLDDRGKERHVYVPGENLTIRLSIRAPTRIEDFVFGVGIFNADGVSVYGTNTHIEDFVSRWIEGEAEVRLVLERLNLVEGTYLVDVAAHRKDGTPYDYHRGLYSFRMKSRIKDVGVYRPEHRWSFSGELALTPPEPRGELDLHEEG